MPTLWTRLAKSGPSLGDVHVPAPMQAMTQGTPQKRRRRNPRATEGVSKGKGYNPYRGQGGRFTSGAGSAPASSSVREDAPSDSYDYRAGTASRKNYSGFPRKLAEELRAHDDFIESAGVEVDFNEDTGRDSPSYWVGLHGPYMAPGLGTGTIHEFTADGVRREMRGMSFVKVDMNGRAGQPLGESESFLYATDGKNVYRQTKSRRGWDEYGGWRWESEDTPTRRRLLSTTQGVSFYAVPPRNRTR